MKKSSPAFWGLTLLWGAMLVGIPFYFVPKDPRALPVGIGAALLFAILAFIAVGASAPRLSRLAWGVLWGAALANFSSFTLFSIARSRPGGEVLIVLAYFGALGLGLAWGLAGEAAAPAAGPSPAPAPAEKESARGGIPKLLDTSAIIDGRIADVVEVGFLEGPLLLPEFVLRELQIIADSSDATKRTRGRRGLDILKRLRESRHAALEIRPFTDPVAVAADERAIDARLVRAAKAVGGTLVTTDFNLNKVAGLQGVRVLNINDLANAMKTVLLPGEEIEIVLTREGKEPNQGVGYLEDGTMVVVDDAKSLIGQKAKIIVTNLHQTSAGRMIFGKRA